MQTFLPYPLFKDSAKVLDNRRLGKQRVECLQLLNVLRQGPIVKVGEEIRKTAWYNHPAARMWKGYERQLAIYGLYICHEWISRGFKDTCFEKIETILKTDDPNYVFQLDRCIDYFSKEVIPQWLGDKAFHASHRSNLLRKDPVWYGQFGWIEPNDLPYVWPV